MSDILVNLKCVIVYLLRVVGNEALHTPPNKLFYRISRRGWKLKRPMSIGSYISSIWMYIYQVSQSIMPTNSDKLMNHTYTGVIFCLQILMKFIVSSQLVESFP